MRAVVTSLSMDDWPKRVLGPHGFGGDFFFFPQEDAYSSASMAVKRVTGLVVGVRGGGESGPLKADQRAACPVT